MTVFNGARFLREAIESCLNQTFTDLELIIIDDGSTDCSLAIINSFEDDRIVLLINESNKGQSFSRNKGIKESSGGYIAIMDADDVAYPDRIEKQVIFLTQNEGISIVGSYVSVINEKGEILKLRRFPANNDEIKVDLIFNCPLLHSAVMWRKSDFEKYKLEYSEDFIYAQDMELWSRAMFYVNFANLPEPLIYSRFRNSNSVTAKFPDKQRECGERIVEATLNRMGIRYKKELLEPINKSNFLIHVACYLTIIVKSKPALRGCLKLNYFVKRIIK
jgi:glycosyltransferase involved in cell wall biosynthesis